MIGIGVSPFIKKSNISYDADALAYFNSVPTTFTSEQKSAINQLFIDLKSGTNNFQYILRDFLLSNYYQANAVYSAINPASDIATEHGTIAWNTSGYLSNGSNGYLNSKFIASTHGGSLFTLTSACVFWCSDTDVAENTMDWGVFEAGGFRVSYAQSKKSSNNQASLYLNQTSSLEPQVAVNSTKRFFSLVKTSATNFDFYIDGVYNTSFTVTNASGLNTAAMFICAFNNGPGTAANFSNRRMQVWGCGSKDINQLELYNAHRKYLNNLIEKRTNILIAGQSNATALYAISGNITTPYTNQRTQVYARLDSKGDIQNYQEGVNSYHVSSPNYSVSCGLAYRLENTHNKKVQIINAAVGNTSLYTPAIGTNTWNKDTVGNLIDVAITKYIQTTAKSNPNNDKVFVWIQGENDASSATAASEYYNRMVELIAYVRQEIGSDTKVVIAQLLSTANTYYAQIRQAQQDICNNISNCYFYQTQGVLTLHGDNIHWNEASIIDGGEDIADIIAPLISY